MIFLVSLTKNDVLIADMENIMFRYWKRNYPIEISEYSIIAKFRKMEVRPRFDIISGSDNAAFRPPCDL